MTFKDSKNKVAQAYGYESWDAIKWFELDQRFEYERTERVKSFNVLLEEAVEAYKDAAVEAALHVSEELRVDLVESSVDTEDLSEVDVEVITDILSHDNTSQSDIPSEEVKPKRGKKK